MYEKLTKEEYELIFEMVTTSVGLMDERELNKVAKTVDSAMGKIKQFSDTAVISQPDMTAWDEDPEIEYFAPNQRKCHEQQKH